MVVLNVCIEDTHEAAIESARPGHDEFWKFLGPYGWSRGYMGDDGKPVGPGLIPTLEQSMEQRTILVGSPEEVAAGVQAYQDELGLEYLTIYPHLPGDPYAKAVEQMERFMTEVVPLVS
jgi:alkanesulfonate monooxygenase SsuD/methylene tetrahydromethanopterin reductase-like flavin-dependent oxidoreductase (luciferase family)